MGPSRDCAIAASFLRTDGRGAPTKWTTPVLYTQQWAYVPIGPHGGCELYHLADDPYAAGDVAAQHTDIVEALHARLLAWLREVDAPAEALVPFSGEPVE